MPMASSLILRVIDEKDTKLKADELGAKRMIFYPSGFDCNDRMWNCINSKPSEY
jgi:hypothetical protein